MRDAIRDWIQVNHQPWRMTPSKSLHQGPIGAPGTLPVNRATRAYYEGKGVSVDGRFFEDLMESELLLILESISGWLSAEDQRTLDEAAAFGLCSTNLPNACAMRCLGGYAILIDFSFISMMISALELYYGSLLGSDTIDEGNFPLALNTTVITEFFHIVDPADALSYKPGEDFAYRKLTDKALWFLLVFILSHEAGHILLKHLIGAPDRDALFRTHSGGETVAVLRPAHQNEFDADRFAIELIIQGHDHGGLIRRDASEERVWQANYGILGWMFTILDVVEILAGRIELPITDTHPSGGERWSRIDAALRHRGLIRPETSRIAQAVREKSLEAAGVGALPVVNKDALKRLGRLPAYPAELVREAAALEKALDLAWRPPPIAAIEAWLSAATPEAANAILREHPGFLDPQMDNLLYGMALKQPDEVVAAKILMLRLPIIQRSRQIGIDPAFEELVSGRLPPPSLPAKVFAIPANVWQQFESALEAGERERCDLLVAQSPELTAVMELPSTIARLVNTRTAAHGQYLLHLHPELLHPMADRFFASIAAEQVSDAARSRVEQFRALVSRCREVGLSRAIQEIMAKER